MPEVKFKNTPFLYGLGLLCLVLLFVGGPGSHSSRTFTYGWGMGHLFCFALWTRLYLGWRTDLPARRQIVEVLLLAALLGAGTELLQAVVGREASWQDLGNDLLGSLVALAFFSALREQLRTRQLQILQAMALGLVFWSLLPLGKVMLDELIAWRQFPLLAGFETGLEKERFGGNSKRRIDHEVFFSGTASLKVELNTVRYSGVALKYFPADWEGYRALRVQLFNPGPEDFQFHFRIHDRQHERTGNVYSDRFNTSLTVLPGWNSLEFPLQKVAEAPKKRRMDLTEIAGAILFVGKLKRPQTIYLDELQLVR